MDQVGPLTDQRGKGERGGWRLTGRSQLFVDPLMGPVDTRFQPFQKLVLLVHPEVMKTSDAWATYSSRHCTAAPPASPPPPCPPTPSATTARRGAAPRTRPVRRPFPRPAR